MAVTSEVYIPWGTVKHIHVRPQEIKDNLLRGTNHPTMVVEDLQTGKIYYCHEVTWQGASQLKFSKEPPTALGAHVWVETMGPVTMIVEEK